MNMIPIQLLLVFLLAFAGEAMWAVCRGHKIYSGKEVLANMGVMLGNQLLRPLSMAWKLLLFSWIEPFCLMPIPVSATTVVFTFLAVEFTYYWYHRISHAMPFMWRIHHAHHSGSHMNLTTAIRLNWLGAFVGPVFFVPLILIGFSPAVVVASLALGLYYQFFLHTEALGKMGILEGLFLNTPAAHRVHHGTNSKYIDKNYGACLILFDRWFGTWQPEQEPVRYGVTTGPVSVNPFIIVLGPVVAWLLRDLKREKHMPSARIKPRDPQNLRWDRSIAD